MPWVDPPSQAGKYAKNEGTGLCSECLQGFFANETTTHTCNSCPLGFYSSLGVTACSECSAGSSDHDNQPSTVCQPRVLHAGGP